MFQRPRRWTARQRLKAVHEDDLENVLGRLGLLEMVTEGKATCAVCGTRIDLENLQALFRREGKIGFVCSKVGCYERLVEGVEV